MSVAASPPPAGAATGVHTAAAPLVSARTADACPLCGAALHPEQEWCLQCGAAARTRLAAAPNWRTPMIALTVVLVLSLGVLAGALVDLAGSSDSGAQTTTTVTRTSSAVSPTPSTSTSTPTTSIPTTTLPGATVPGTTSVPNAAGALPRRLGPGAGGLRTKRSILGALEKRLRERGLLPLRRAK